MTDVNGKGVASCSRTLRQESVLLKDRVALVEMQSDTVCLRDSLIHCEAAASEDTDVSPFTPHTLNNLSFVFPH